MSARSKVEREKQQAATHMMSRVCTPDVKTILFGVPAASLNDCIYICSGHSFLQFVQDSGWGHLTPGSKHPPACVNASPRLIFANFANKLANFPVQGIPRGCKRVYLPQSAGQGNCSTSPLGVFPGLVDRAKQLDCHAVGRSTVTHSCHFNGTTTLHWRHRLSFKFFFVDNSENGHRIPEESMQQQVNLSWVANSVTCRNVSTEK